MEEVQGAVGHKGGAPYPEIREGPLEEVTFTWWLERQIGVSLAKWSLEEDLRQREQNV